MLKILSKKEAIDLHRKMWNRIANVCCTIEIAYPGFSISRRNMELIIAKNTGANNSELSNNCYLCTYTKNCCSMCPLDWGTPTCCDNKSPYKKFCESKSWDEAVDWAEVIAQLPERITSRF